MKINLSRCVATSWLIAFWILFICSLCGVPYIVWHLPLLWFFGGILILVLYGWLIKA